MTARVAVASLATALLCAPCWADMPKDMVCHSEPDQYQVDAVFHGIATGRYFCDDAGQNCRPEIISVPSPPSSSHTVCVPRSGQ